MRGAVLIAALLSGLVLASTAGADGTPLAGSVGPSFTISLQDGSGRAVLHLDPGAYTLTVQDLSDEHDFHLFGPGGVDVSSTVEGQGTRTVDLVLQDGTYDFICDAHPTRMHGSFTVGAVTQPPAPPQPARLTLVVGDKAVTLRTAAGARVRALAPGPYAIKVVDRSKRQNAHVSGAGVNRRTGVLFVGTTTWKVTVRAGSLVVRSDVRRPKLSATTVRVAADG
jgi:hypothetical protein